MRYLLMIGLLAAGPAWGQTIPGLRDSDVRAMVDGIRSDGFGRYLAGACGETTATEDKSIYDRADTEMTGLAGQAPVLAYSTYVDGLKRAKAAVEQNKPNACALLTPAAIKRAHDLAAGRARLFDSTASGATPGRIYVPVP